MHFIVDVATDKLGYSRDNHLGNTIGGEMLRYEWVIPEMEQVNGADPECVLRMRYNISTGDYDNWNTFSPDNVTPLALPTW